VVLLVLLVVLVLVPLTTCHSAGPFGGSQPVRAVCAWMHL
jgi:hypothetical protein